MSSEQDRERALLSASRAFCEHHAGVCGTHPDDEWALYSDEYKAQARVVIDAYERAAALAKGEGKV